MYKPVKTGGDTIEVPQLVFSKLDAPGGDGRFKVALFLLQSGGAEPARIARVLRMPREQVESALSFWEGAGLIEREEEDAQAPPPVTAAPRVRMTARQVLRAAEADATLGMLLSELQRLFGTTVGESDANIYVTLYVQDGFAADLILTAAAETAKRGVRSARYVEKMLMNWRRQGIGDCASADRYLKQLAEREAREWALAKRWNLAGDDPFTLAEKKKIAQWYEEYGYDTEMIEAARLAAGDKQNEVKYLSGILKKWYAKGFCSPRQVQQAEGGANLRVTKGGAVANDLLAGATGYVPMKRRQGK